MFLSNPIASGSPPAPVIPRSRATSTALIRSRGCGGSLSPPPPPAGGDGVGAGGGGDCGVSKNRRAVAKKRSTVAACAGSYLPRSMYMSETARSEATTLKMRRPIQSNRSCSLYSPELVRKVGRIHCVEVCAGVLAMVVQLCKTISLF